MSNQERKEKLQKLVGAIYKANEKGVQAYDMLRFANKIIKFCIEENRGDTDEISFYYKHSTRSFSVGVKRRYENFGFLAAHDETQHLLRREEMRKEFSRRENRRKKLR